jgi:hypothetical protein
MLPRRIQFLKSSGRFAPLVSKSRRSRARLVIYFADEKPTCNERTDEETALTMKEQKTDKCPRCGEGRLRRFDELSEEEQEVTRCLPASADYAADERRATHTWCSKCWYEATQARSLET